MPACDQAGLDDEVGTVAALVRCPVHGAAMGECARCRKAAHEEMVAYGVYSFMRRSKQASYGRSDGVLFYQG